MSCKHQHAFDHGAGLYTCWDCGEQFRVEIPTPKELIKRK